MDKIKQEPKECHSTETNETSDNITESVKDEEKETEARKESEECCCVKAAMAKEQEKLVEIKEEQGASEAGEVNVEEKSYTPPLSTSSENKIEETPKRSTCTPPTALFSSLEESEHWVDQKMKVIIVTLRSDVDEESASNEEESDGNMQSLETSKKSASKEIKAEGILRSLEKEKEVLSGRQSISSEEVRETEFSPESSLDSRAQKEETAETSVCRMTAMPGVSKEPEVATSSDSSTAEKTGEAFCGSLKSAMDLASPDALRSLSSEEVFQAHQNLSELMSKVVESLRSRWQSPRH